MLITLRGLRNKYDLHISGVIHVGAHTAEEASDYSDNGISRVWWIEANSDLIPKIRENIKRYPDHHLIQALVYGEDDVDLDFHITNIDGMSSSILEFGTHAKKAPHCRFVKHAVLRTSKLDTLVEEYDISGCNMLAMDLQGAEMHALQGAEKLIDSIDYVYTEINIDELYKGCARLWQLDEWLGERSFLRVETSMAENQVGWGDALYIRYDMR